MVKLYPYQKETIDKLKSGSILCGGVGSGKSITAVYYYFTKECGGILTKKGIPIKMENPKDLYVITTAKKRNTGEWEHECAKLGITSFQEDNIGQVKRTIDSWNNIKKYEEVKDAFFIFDEQRLVGAGTWVKTFLKIAKNNRWILLTATPGDVWLDYAPVFIANGFYRNRTDFVRKHVVYRPMVRYYQVDHYINCHELVAHKCQILVLMNYKPAAEHRVTEICCKYDESKYRQIVKDNWDVFYDEPITTASKCCYVLRRVVNETEDRLQKVVDIINGYKNCPKFNKVIVFYNFTYERDMLVRLKDITGIPVYEYNGERHDEVPVKESKWIYIVQYSAGCEGWNCIETNCVIFYSLDYSYRKMYQASGRIDRANSPYNVLYYFVLKTISRMDTKILEAIKSKKKFNEKEFSSSLRLAEITGVYMEGELKYAKPFGTISET